MAATSGTKYLISAVTKALALEDWLAGDNLLEWRSLKDIVAALKFSQNETYRLLKTLAAAGRVEESDKGWRISPDGIIRHSFKVAEYFSGQAQRFGLKGD